MAYKDKASDKKWREEHRDSIKTYKKQWDKAHPKNLAEHARYIVKKHKEYVERWKEFFRITNRDHCEICGYSKCFAALDFHELIPRLGGITPSDFIRTRPPSEKNIKVTENWQTLCANCHRELHNSDKN